MQNRVKSKTNLRPNFIFLNLIPFHVVTQNWNCKDTRRRVLSSISEKTGIHFRFLRLVEAEECVLISIIRFLSRHSVLSLRIMQLHYRAFLLFLTKLWNCYSLYPNSFQNFRILSFPLRTRGEYAVHYPRCWITGRETNETIRRRDVTLSPLRHWAESVTWPNTSCHVTLSAQSDVPFPCGNSPRGNRIIFSAQLRTGIMLVRQWRD